MDGKTRVVAVNSTTFLQHFDLIVCLKAGKVTYCGPFSGLHNQSSASLISQISSHTSASSNNDDKEKAVKVEAKKPIQGNLIL